MAKKKTLSNPDSAEREYTRLLTGFVRELRADVNAALIPSIPGIADQFNAEIRADSWTDAIAWVMAELLSLATIKTTRIIDRLPGMYALINRHNERQFGMVVRANTGLTVPEARLMNGPGALNSTAPVRNALGVNIFRGEPYLAPLYDGWIAENTKLVKSIPEQYHSGLEDTLRRGIMGGDSPRDLTRKIRERFGVTERRAKLIAVDQTLSAHAELTRYRMQSVGVKEYIWRTVKDNRVRPEHMEREGKKYSWDKPPAGGHPGQPIRCLPYGSNIEFAQGCSRLWRRSNTTKTTLLVTESGEFVEATKNHPVLTNRGWLPIDMVNSGDYLVKASGNCFDGLMAYVEGRPPKIGEIFDSVSGFIGFDTTSVASASEFNGDAIDCEVQTVNVNSFLPNVVNGMNIEKFGKLLFTEADNNISDSILNINRSFYLLAPRLFNSSNSLIRGFCKLLFLLNSHLAHSEKIGLASASNWLSRFLQSGDYGASANAVLFGHGQNTHSGIIVSDQQINRNLFSIMSRLNASFDGKALFAEDFGKVASINSKRIGSVFEHGPVAYQFSRVSEKIISEFTTNHVYNLETKLSWYSTSNLIVHNCRCSAEAVFPDDE